MLFFRINIVFKLLVIIFVGSLLSCKRNEEVEFSQNSCKKFPAFASQLGFKNANFETADPRIRGLVLRQREVPGNLSSRVIKEFQHPSWKQAGWLAPVLIDNEGNIFTAPAPFVGIEYNPIIKNNIIYRVNQLNGEMKEFVNLPGADSINTENPFGIIGMAYLCEAQVLYVSTVAGSSRYKQQGSVYAVDAKTGKILDRLSNYDVLGLGISYASGHRELFLGMARSSEVYSVYLDKKGKFSSRPKFAFTLSGLGPAGDDKARKIAADKQGNLTVYGFEFGFNLIPARDKKETVFQFQFAAEEGKWKFKN